MSFAPAEPRQPNSQRGALHVSDDGGSKEPAAPHTATGAKEDGEHSRSRVLSVKLDLRGKDATFKRIVELSWQAARYRNLFLRAMWAEAKSLRVDQSKGDAHGVTKWIRASEKMELSGAAYSAAERETAVAWRMHGRRVLAGAPLPEWKPTAALSIRGHKNKRESGIRLSFDSGKFVAHIQAQASTCDGGCWIEIPLAVGTEKDYQSELLQKMADWEVPVLKASLVVKPFKHQVLLRLSYAAPFYLPKPGNRHATFGPVAGRRGIFLRTECETRDFSGRLTTILQRKEDWDLIRRRCMAQIGRRKGSARAKRKLLAKLSWDEWLSTQLHQWSAEVMEWLATQGVCSLAVIGLEQFDIPVFRLTEMLKYKGEDRGIKVHSEVDLAEPGTERAVKAEIRKTRRKASKAGKAIRELQNTFGGK